MSLTKSSLTAVAQISAVCNLILGRHPQARLAHSTGGRSGRWTQPAATGNETIMWEVACWAGNLTGRPGRFVSGFLCNSRAGSRSDQDCCHRDLQKNARQLTWGSAWEGVHTSPRAATQRCWSQCRGGGEMPWDGVPCKRGMLSPAVYGTSETWTQTALPGKCQGVAEYIDFYYWGHIGTYCWRRCVSHCIDFKFRFKMKNL